MTLVTNVFAYVMEVCVSHLFFVHIINFLLLCILEWTGRVPNGEECHQEGCLLALGQQDWALFGQCH